MDIYRAAADLILNRPLLQDWLEIREMIEFACNRTPHAWRLPVIACEAVGGNANDALPAVAGIACMQISIILIDDMLDDDPRGVYRRLGAAATTNLASALQAAGLEVVALCHASKPQKLAAILEMNHMVLTTAWGQELDIQNPTSEEAYWNLVHTKSSPFFGAALYAGAVLGSATKDQAEAIKRFGYIYGEMVQIHDDLNDAMETPASPDWLQERSSLPILYAQIVEHPDREKFMELRHRSMDPISLREAQSILIRCGAVSYGIHLLLQKRKLAQETLNLVDFYQRTGLENLIEEVIRPVMKMFEAIGMEYPEVMLETPPADD
jgi:geranylgeranyl pyrophosphate synthase